MMAASTSISFESSFDDFDLECVNAIEMIENRNNIDADPLKTSKHKAIKKHHATNNMFKSETNARQKSKTSCTGTKSTTSSSLTNNHTSQSSTNHNTLLFSTLLDDSDDEGADGVPVAIPGTKSVNNKKRERKVTTLSLNATGATPKDNVKSQMSSMVDGTPADNTGSTGTSLRAPDSDELKLSSWGLPDAVYKRYEEKAISQMFPWQAECLCLPGVLGGSNLVYSAPTSAGKTMVAELLILKRVLETKRKAIMILPFVSVAREKMHYMQHMFQDVGIRVEGYMGSHSPAGGFNATDIAVCTIEKANSLINRLLQENSIDQLGIIVVDELHMVGDAHRGYLLELLLTKVSYMSKKRLAENVDDNSHSDKDVQIVGMSATLPNLNMLARWLKAQLYHTDYRPVPLQECVKIGNRIYNNKYTCTRRISNQYNVQSDEDHIISLSLETILAGHAILVFCPTKQWCEKLAEIVAKEFYRLCRDKSNEDAVRTGDLLRGSFSRGDIDDVLEQLKRSPVGLDMMLGRVVPYGVAFHHAGLTFDERDIVEGAFRRGVLKVLIATSTLSSGVNLPARRVIIRTPTFHAGQTIDALTYKQMIGRAGRKGVDTEGESILICKETEKKKAEHLLSAELPAVKSCLIKNQHDSLSNSMKRAILEVIVSGVTKTPADVALYAKCTLLATTLSQSSDDTDVPCRTSGSGSGPDNAIESCIEFLVDNEFILLQEQDGEDVAHYTPTQLGTAVLSSALSPDEGLIVFAELQKARKCFVLETELHIIYQVTPIYDMIGSVDWYNYMCMWERLSPSMRRVGDLVGVQDSFLTKAVQGRIRTNTMEHRRLLALHKRFYTSLILHDLVNEMPLAKACEKYGCTRGVLQSLQQSSATFAGMVTVFCNRLGWTNLEILLAQFQSRLTFGVQRELVDLVRLSLFTAQRARVFFDAGLQTVAAISSANIDSIELLLRNAAPFQSKKASEGESEWEAARRNKTRCIWLTGQKGLTEREAAEMIRTEAENILKDDLAGMGVEWKPKEKQDTEHERRADAAESTTTPVREDTRIKNHSGNNTKVSTVTRSRQKAASRRSRRSNSLVRNSGNQRKRSSPLVHVSKPSTSMAGDLTVGTYQSTVDKSIVLNSISILSPPPVFRDQIALSSTLVNPPQLFCDARSSQTLTVNSGTFTVNDLGDGDVPGGHQKKRKAEPSSYGRRKSPRLIAARESGPAEINRLTKGMDDPVANPEPSKSAPVGIPMCTPSRDEAGTIIEHRTTPELFSEVPLSSNTEPETKSSGLDEANVPIADNLPVIQSEALFSESMDDVGDSFTIDTQLAAMLAGNEKRSSVTGGRCQRRSSETGGRCQRRSSETGGRCQRRSSVTGGRCQASAICGSGQRRTSVPKVPNQRIVNGDIIDDFANLSDSLTDSFMMNIDTQTDSGTVVQYESSSHVTTTTPHAGVTLKCPLDQNTSVNMDDILDAFSDSDSYYSLRTNTQAAHGSLCELDMNITSALDQNIDSQMSADFLSPMLGGRSLKRSANSSMNTSAQSNQLFSSTPNLHSSPKVNHLSRAVPHCSSSKENIVSSTSAMDEFDHDTFDDEMMTAVLDRVEGRTSVNHPVTTPVSMTRPLNVTELSPEMAAIMNAMCEESPAKHVKRAPLRKRNENTPHSNLPIRDVSLDNSRHSRNTSTDSDFVPPTPPCSDESTVAVNKTGMRTPKCPKTPTGVTPIRYSLRSTSQQQRHTKRTTNRLLNSTSKTSARYSMNCTDIPLTNEAFSIIDVAANAQLFEHFINEWKTKSCFSIALACEQAHTTQSGKEIKRPIGGQLSAKSRPLPVNHSRSGLLSADGLVQVVGMSICWGCRDAYYVSFCQQSCTDNLDDSLAEPNLDPTLTVAHRLKVVQQILQQTTVPKTTIAQCTRMFGVREHLRCLGSTCGLEVRGQIEDPKVAAWMLDCNAKEQTLNGMVMNELPLYNDMLQGLGGGVGLGSISLNPHNAGSGRIRATVESVLVYHLMDMYHMKLIEANIQEIYINTEMPSCVLLAKMEQNGFGYSIEESKCQQSQMEHRLQELEQQAYQLAGRQFNMSSSQDVGQVLFIELRLPSSTNGTNPTPQVNRLTRVTKRPTRNKKVFTTTKEALEKLTNLHPLPGVILEYRRIHAALSLVIVPLQKLAVENELLKMHRIYGICHTFTSTGRVTMHEPNLQNVYKDFDMETKNTLTQKTSTKCISMRHTFIPFKGGVILAADYSQLELRIIAHLSKDRKLLQTLNSGADVFKNIAAQIHGTSASKVTDIQRQQAKQVCYGMVYGIGAKGLSEQLGVTEKEANSFMDMFKSKYPEMRNFLRDIVSECRSCGYVTTMIGRQRPLSSINDTNPHARAQSERQSVNTTIQGSAADLVKQAMIAIDKKLSEAYPNTRLGHRHKAGRRVSNPRGAFLVLQLHDELIYEVNSTDVKTVCEIIKHGMENSVKLHVKLPVKMKVGPTWGRLREVDV